MIPSDDTTNPHHHRRRRIERTIYIYENERLWVGRGYTKRGLLPTEGGPYSSPDGSLHRKTIEDASLALLGAIDGGVKDEDANEEKTGSGGRRKRRSSGGLVRNRGWSFHAAGDDGDGDGDGDDRGGGFVTCFGTEADGPTDIDGWQYFRDFSPKSLSSPNAKR